MKFAHRALAALLVPFFFPAPAQALAPQGAVPAQETAREPARYVRAKEGGAKVYNLPSANGERMSQVPQGALLAVYGEKAGWLDVEPSSGLKAWVFGEYLKRTPTPGLAEISGNSVLMRPLPSSDEKSYPLATRLSKGERVRVLARADPKKPLREDWVQIAAPPGSRAWISAADAIPVAASEDVRTAWTKAAKDAQAALPVVDLAEAEEASAPKGAPQPRQDKADPRTEPTKATAVDKVGEAEKLMAAARGSESPDFASARKAYEAVIAESPQGASADTARRRLEEISIREEIQRLRADKATLEEQRKEKLADAEARLREVSRAQDPLWGRFQARGWLERDTAYSTPRYVVRWSGKDVAEAICTSGRYGLDDFVGHEVGILGVTSRAATEATPSGPAMPPRIDVTRIEVISTRAGR